MNFRYVHVPKTGGTSVSKILFRDERFEGKEHSAFANRPMIECEEEYLKYHPTPRLFRFAFVRNPWDWQLSAFHHGREKEEGYREFFKGLTFEEFLIWRRDEQA